MPTNIFCPICGGHHDQDVPCFDLTQQAMKDMGIPRNPPSSPWKFKSLVQKANKNLILVLVILLAMILFSILIEGRMKW